jgi:glycosyltransferase involved in cell wall biosynthesis
VIASRAGGIPEVVEDGVTGLLFPVGDVDAMAAGAIALLSDPERFRGFARRAREQAVARFSEAAVVARYRALYERTLGRLAAGGGAREAPPG